jgi:hypothetical protein
LFLDFFPQRSPSLSLLSGVRPTAFTRSGAGPESTIRRSNPSDWIKWKQAREARARRTRTAVLVVLTVQLTNHHLHRVSCVREEEVNPNQKGQEANQLNQPTGPTCRAQSNTTQKKKRKAHVFRLCFAKLPSQLSG